jgi:cyclic pyranopterin phosphate synthase
MSKALSHINEHKEPTMVDVSHKSVTHREARAQAIVTLGREIMSHLREGELIGPKGPVFHTAIIAGTLAVKRTHELIPFCHPLPISSVNIRLTPRDEESVHIVCEVKCEGKTGIEMEALTGANVAALCVYDMCKAMSHDITINEVRLLSKSGGKSGYVYAS